MTARGGAVEPGGPAAAAAVPGALPAGPPRGAGGRRPPPTSASASGSCAATWSCCGCAGCPATARATWSTCRSPATRSRSPRTPACAGPLRLTTAEATALLVALRTLGDMPGMVDTAAVRRATAKIERAVGGGAGCARGGRRRHAARSRPPPRPSGRRSRRAARCAIRYYTAGRDAVTAAHGRPHAAADRRGPRLPGGVVPPGRGGAAVPPGPGRGRRRCSTSRPRRRPTPSRPTCRRGCSAPSAEHRSAVLLLEPWARWIAEYYPVEEVVELDDGRARVLLRYADPAWLVRLVLGPGRRRAGAGAAGARGAVGAPGPRGAGRAPAGGPDGRTEAVRRRDRLGRGGWWRWPGAGVVLVLAVRPPARRLARAAAALRGDLDTRLGAAARPAPTPGPRADPHRTATPSARQRRPSSIGGRGRHRRPAAAP